MKETPCCARLIFALVVSIFLTGCVLRTATVSPRQFVLAPMPADESSNTPNSDLSVEIGVVRMPAYLLRDSIAVRTSPNEIEYLENALWAERLDKSFQRTLVANLSQSFFSAEIQPVDFRPRDHTAEQTSYPNPPFVRLSEGQKIVRIQINVERFDVDTRGQGQLIAKWRITTPEISSLLKSGSTSLTRSENLTRGDPRAVAKNMSALIAEFSHELALFISGVVSPGTISRSE